MPATLQERLARSEVNELINFAVELRPSLSANGAGMGEQEIRQRTDLIQQGVDHVLGIPQRMRKTVEDSKARASAGKRTDLKEAGEALTSLLAQFTSNVKVIASIATAYHGAGYQVEGVDRLPAAVAEMVKLTEETIEEWPWPESWWPAVDQEMLPRSYEQKDFLTQEEAIRELLQRTPK
jgi:hypothetical protein